MGGGAPAPARHGTSVAFVLGGVALRLAAEVCMATGGACIPCGRVGRWQYTVGVQDMGGAVADPAVRAPSAGDGSGARGLVTAVGMFDAAYPGLT